MTFKTISLTIAGLALTGCMETGMGAAVSGPLTTEQAFRDTIVGRTVTFNGSNSFVVNANGTVTGPWDGSGITGTWYWEGQYWCRDIAIGGTARPNDCQT